MSERKRTSPQNRKMHACLRDIAEQVKHPQNGWMHPDAWKVLFLENLGAETRWIASLYGERMVPLWHSRNLRTDMFADLLTTILMYGDHHGVAWSDPEWVALQQNHAEAA